MSVLVTGASGFLGAALVRALGKRAVAATRSGHLGPRLSAWDGRALRLDPRDAARTRGVIADLGPSAVVHAAIARNGSGRALEAMVDAVCDAATRAEVPLVVTFGSAAEFGRSAPPLDETSLRQPTTAHGRAKRDEVDAAFRWAVGVDGPTVVILRPFHVTGCGEPLAKLVPRILAAAHGGEPLPLVTGAPVRDLVHVDDVVTGVLAALDSPPDDGLPVNLCSGVPTTPTEVVAAVERAVGHIVPIAGTHPRTAFDDEHRIGDPTRAATLWGWRAAPLEELVERCLAAWPWRAP